MTRIERGLLAGALCALVPLAAQAAGAGCPADNGGVPPGANTTDPAAPFFVDTRGLDFRTSPPTRNPHDPRFPRATDLPDGTLPAVTADGNFVLGPTHAPDPTTRVDPAVAHGTVRSFTMSSADSTIYRPGLIRDDIPGCRNSAVNTAATVPGDPSNMLVPTSHAGVWRRTVDVYVPAGARPGVPLPFVVIGDGGPGGFFNERMVFTVLDNLIAAGRLPPMAAIGVGSGGQDAQGAERGREYDAVDGRYGEWIEHEVLPEASQVAGVTLTADPDGRATMGVSSSGVAAFTMAWFHPEWFRRVLAYSPTFVNQQWPHDTALPGGAWEYHSAWAGPATPAETVTGISVTATDLPSGAPLIPNSPTKPIRFWFEAGDRDLFYPAAPMRDGMHDWVMANERTAAALAAKGYAYQFVFSRNAGHGDKATVAQTLPEALLWLWQGYRTPSGAR